MNKMTIHCLFGQAPQSYEGQHAPELLCAVDEFVLEGNPDCWEDVKSESLRGGYGENFEKTVEVDVEAA